MVRGSATDARVEFLHILHSQSVYIPLFRYLVQSDLLQQESLATSFEGVTLFDDALVQYEELEVSFDQVLKEKNLSWFGTLITPTPTDDSAPLLSISKKPYRDLILANNISVFDFRIYLLSRQCELLSKAGRLTEVCTKVGVFLSAFGRRLREVEVCMFD